MLTSWAWIVLFDVYTAAALPLLAWALFHLG